MVSILAWFAATRRGPRPALAVARPGSELPDTYSTELDLERNEDAAQVIETLADSRLITLGDGSVEVAHEALLSEWPRLRAWIDEDADGRRLRRHITQAAAEWNADGRDPGGLYRGARLAAALDWSADHARELNQLEREFVAESHDASEKETRRVRRTNFTHSLHAADVARRSPPSLGRAAFQSRASHAVTARPLRGNVSAEALSC